MAETENESSLEENNVEAEIEMPSHLGTELEGEKTSEEQVELAQEEEIIKTSNDNDVEDAMRAWVAGGRSVENEEAAVKPVQFAQLERAIESPQKTDSERLNNVNVNMSVDLARKEMTVRELADLKLEGIIVTEKLQGESFDIRINERVFAEGEIVVNSETISVRITKMLDIFQPDNE